MQRCSVVNVYIYPGNELISLETRRAAQHHGLDRDSRSEGQQGTPLRKLVAAAAILLSTPAELVEHEDDRGAAHVPVLAQHLPARRQLPFLQLEHGVDVIQDRAPTGVHRPEEVVPARDAVLVVVPKRGPERFAQTLFDVLPDQHRHLDGQVEVDAAARDLHPQHVLRQIGRAHV